jgi:hypothetical protein
MTWPDSGRARVACSEATLGGSASIVASVGTIARSSSIVRLVSMTVFEAEAASINGIRFGSV